MTTWGAGRHARADGIRPPSLPHLHGLNLCGQLSLLLCVVITWRRNPCPERVSDSTRERDQRILLSWWWLQRSHARSSLLLVLGRRHLRPLRSLRYRLRPPKTLLALAPKALLLAPVRAAKRLRDVWILNFIRVVDVDGRGVLPPLHDRLGHSGFGVAQHNNRKPLPLPQARRSLLLRPVLPLGNDPFWIPGRCLSSQGRVVGRRTRFRANTTHSFFEEVWDSDSSTMRN